MPSILSGCAPRDQYHETNAYPDSADLHSDAEHSVGQRGAVGPASPPLISITPLWAHAIRQDSMVDKEP